MKKELLYNVIVHLNFYELAVVILKKPGLLPMINLLIYDFSLFYFSAIIYRIKVEEITNLLAKKIPNTFPTHKICVGNALDFDITSLLFQQVTELKPSAL